MTSKLYEELADSANDCLEVAAITHTPGILIVDDMGLILTLLKFALEPMGYTVWQATNGNKGFDLYRMNMSKIDVVLLDSEMPGWDGPQTLSAIRRLNPDVLACFMTGHSGDHTHADLLEFGVVHVFQKPFRATEVATMLDDILHKARTFAPSSRARRSRGRSHAIA